MRKLLSGRLSPPLVLRAVALAMGMLLSVAVGSVLIPNAPAQAVDSCLNDGDYAVKGGHEIYQFENASGTRSDMFVPGQGVTCQHISSIYIGYLNGGAEFGWIRGWSNCDVNGADQQKYQAPTLFAWYVLTTGSRKTCKVYSNRTPSTGNYHTFRMDDNALNARFGPWIDGTQLESPGVTLDFTTGHSWVAMERGEAADPGIAHWKALEKYAGGSWYSWSDHGRNTNNFGPGSYNVISHTEGEAVE